MMRRYKSLVLPFFCVLFVFLVTGCKFENSGKTSLTDQSKQVFVTPEPEHEMVFNTPTPTPTPEPTAVPTPSAVKKDVKVKGLYLTGWSAGNKERMDYYIKLIEETELNALVIDIKNDDGIVSYESKVPAVVEAGTYLKKYDAKKLLETLHAKDIYVIGRIVCFRDPAYSKKYPERAVKHVDGGLWRENKKDKEITWLNPCDERNWKYIVDIAREAVELGFDEIQFDYVRFPDGDRSKMNFGQTGFVKHEVINNFLAYARKELPDVTLSADIFGIVCVSPEDREDIGQYLELIGKELDYISPMTYPSLYARGQIVNGIKFPNPDLEPYAVVYNTLLMARERLSKVENYKADIRPYLQAYTASWLPEGSYQKYTAEQYRQQIQAVYDAGYEQWIFWDANNKYDPDAFLKE
ncbi:putative glycoside hydrolase [Thermoclostridium stercorarium]|nr:putative glycoside hydrolase [Thermoclostridium stercorarium]UZQ84437.1 putative glycoside hydrolase [Thermoclostridium stercorarium]